MEDRHETNLLVRQRLRHEHDGGVGWHQRPELPQGLVALPAAIGSSKKMRLRFSEIDFHEGGHLDVVNTSVRRPFVAFVPIN
jgi:hypothetical protein